MIEVEAGITIGAGVTLGDIPVPGVILYFETQDENMFITDTGDYLIDEE